MAAQDVENKEVPGLMKSILRLRPATEREKEKITPLTQQNLMVTWLVRTGLGRGNLGSKVQYLIKGLNIPPLYLAILKVNPPFLKVISGLGYWPSTIGIVGLYLDH